MPSPAVNTNSSRTLQCILRRTESWVKPPVSTKTYTGCSTSQGLTHPATVVNTPVHGIRPMSAWSKRWYRGFSQPSSADFTYAYDGVTARYEHLNEPLYQPLQTDGLNIGIWWGLVAGSLPFSPLLEFGADNQARTNVLGKLAQKKWDIGVFAGELKQTAGLVTDLAKSAVGTLESLINLKHSSRNAANNFFREVRRTGSFDKAAESIAKRDVSTLDRLKDGWMQYQFGIRPAYRDVSDAVDYLSQMKADGIPMTVKAKAGAHREDRYWGARQDIMSAWRSTPRCVETCDIHYSLVYEIPTGQVRDLTLLGLDNPYSVAWELVQLSWMVDYVIGVGGWLQSFAATNGMTFREGCRSRLRKVVADELLIEANFPYWAKVTVAKRPRWRPGTFYLERGDFDRTLLESRLLPAVVPSIKGTLGLTQLGNSLFALSNVFSGKGGLR